MFSNARNITKRFLLDPGDYILVPSTYDADTDADYMLRIFFESHGNSAQWVLNVKPFLGSISSDKVIVFPW